MANPYLTLVGLPERQRAALTIIYDKMRAGDTVLLSDAGMAGHSPVDVCRHLGRNELGTVLGVSGSLVGQWTDNGCPRTTERDYDLQQVVDWLVKRAKEKSAAPKRGALSEQKLQAEIDLLRAKLANVQETTMLRAEHQEKISTFARTIKEYFINGARKVAHNFIGCKDVGEAQDILIQFITHGVNMLAKK